MTLVLGILSEKGYSADLCPSGDRQFVKRNIYIYMQFDRKKIHTSSYGSVFFLRYTNSHYLARNGILFNCFSGKLYWTQQCKNISYNTRSAIRMIIIYRIRQKYYTINILFQHYIDEDNIITIFFLKKIIQYILTGFRIIYQI